MRDTLFTFAAITWAHPSYVLGHYDAWLLSLTAIMLWVRSRA